MFNLFLNNSLGRLSEFKFYDENGNKINGRILINSNTTLQAITEIDYDQHLVKYSPA